MPLSYAGDVVLKRFARLVLLGVVAGALVGCVLALLLYLGSNPAFRSYGGWSSFFSLILAGAGIGVAVSVSSILTGSLFVAITDRRLAGSSRRRIRWATGGAVVGAAGFWIAWGIVSGLSSGKWMMFNLFLIVAFVSAVLAGILSSVLVGRVERRRLEPVQPVFFATHTRRG